MESWTRVIVEWVNCLGIAQPSVEDLQDLQNGVFYKNLVSQLSHGNEGTATISSPTATNTTTTIVDESEPVSKFIQAEYPEFMASNECGVDIPDELYIASLLLAQCSQKAAFHRPMCVNLKHETQIHIKKFLELVLPYGKSLTRESLGVAIMELGDATPNTPASTPKPSRPLREFFNSPAARSAQSQRFMNDRNRELRYLRAQLETEQFEKADLLEDLKIQEEKIQNLQKKLNEKSQELKALRNERLKPPTPQSCRKNKRPSDSEERYKRELEQLENANAELQSEIEGLRDEREELARRLTSKDRLHTALKQKFDQAERSVENLAIQLERKNNELLDMRMNNEELREHIREIQKSSMSEQSFEMEAIGRARSPMLLNSSEALSSIIDIQLQEAKEESAQLKIQLDATNDKLETAMRDCDEMKRLNADLLEKTADLDSVRNMLEKLKTDLHLEKTSSVELNEIVARSKNTCEQLESCLRTKDELLEKSKLHASQLDEELVGCRLKISELEASLRSQTSRSSDLESELSRAEQVCENLRATLVSTENVLAQTETKKSSLESELAKAEVTINETEEKIENLKMELSAVDKEKTQSLLAKAETEELAKRAEEKIVHLESKISDYERQIEELNEAKSREIEHSTILRNELGDNISKLDALSLRLEETEKRENSTATRLEAAEKKVAELMELGEEMESQLAQAREQLSGIRVEKKSVEEELSSHVCLVENAKKQIIKLLITSSEKKSVENELASQMRSVTSLKELVERIEQEREESRKNLQQQTAANADLKKAEVELKEIKVQLEDKLTQVQNELAVTIGEKNSVDKELDSYVQLAANMREQINKIEDELKESNKNLQERCENISSLEKDKLELNELRCNLESELQLERQELAAVRAEKAALEEKLSTHVQSAEDLRERLSKIEIEVEESNKNLQERCENIATLEKDKLELNQLRCNLESELQLQRQELVAVRAEKEALNVKVSSHIQSAEELSERLSKIEKELEESDKNLQERCENISSLEKDKLELNALRRNLESELQLEQQELVAVRAEKAALEEKLSSHIHSAAELKGRLSKIEKNFEETQKNLEDQLVANELLTQEKRKQEERSEKLEKELADEREQLVAIQSEKEMLEQEASLYGRSNEDLGAKIVALKGQLDECGKDLQKEREATAALKENESQLNLIKESLEKQLKEERDQLALVQTQKVSLENELADFVRARADMLEEISALHTELESSRKDLQQLQQVNETLKEKTLEASSRIETLQVFETRSSQLSRDLESAEEKCASLREKIVEIAEESSQRADAIKSASLRLEEANREISRLNKKLNEHIQSSEETVTSLEKRLVSSESVCAEAKLEQKLKNEALAVLQAKLEQLTKEKIESELRMKEVIVNLQQVRSSQAGVLEAQGKALKEKSAQLEEAERQLETFTSKLNTLTEEKSHQLESEKLKIEKSEIEALKLKETIEGQTKLVDELQRSLESERNVVAEWTGRCEDLKNNLEDVARASGSLKLELDALWDSVRKACPELARPKEETCSFDNSEGTGISHVVRTFAEDAKTICKAVAILGEANETLKDRLDGEKEMVKRSMSEAEKTKTQLDERITNLENERKRRDEYLELLVKRKQDLQQLLSNAVAKRNEVDDELGALNDKWRDVVKEAQSVLTTGSSACDELKHLQIRQTEIDETLANVNDQHARGLQPLLRSLCRIFLWSEEKLQQAQLVDVVVKNEFSPESELSDEQELLKVDICDNDKVHEDLAEVREKIDGFSSYLKCYETSLKAGVIKRETSTEEKLQAQLEKISKERKEMKDKLDAIRSRNAKLEKNMDDLRNENKKLKNEASAVAPADVTELERLEKLTEKLEKEILRLQIENEELSKNASNNQNDEARLKEVHNEYGLKLEKIKQKMKIAYNEQITKLNQEQEKAMKDKIESLRGQMEQQCRKYTEDIAKYKAHISDLSSRYWDVGEKLLAETQEKQAALHQLQQLKGQQQGAIAEASQQVAVSQSRQLSKTASLDRRDFGADRVARENAARSGYRAVEVIEEETTTFSTRRHSVKSIQAMGNAFKAEDEEGEVFDSVYLADLKEGRCAPMGPDFDRLSELRMRNSMCRPHLRSSYAVETHVQPITLNEDDIKNGVTGDDVFNDSLSQSLLPGQKPKKKDRTQTSYKRPGPPTPSKNGGRLSLQGNELKSPGSRILRERNVERRTTATPRGLKHLFGTSISKRQDENTAGGTPKGRRLSNIFRKQRPERN